MQFRSIKALFKRGGKSPCCTLHVSLARVLATLYMVYFNDVLMLIFFKQILERWWLVIICNYMLFHICGLFLLLVFRLWNIKTNGQYPNWDSVKTVLIVLLLLTFMKDATREKAFSFWHTFLQRLWTWSSSFRFMSIVIPRRTCMLNSIEQTLITTELLL